MSSIRYVRRRSMFILVFALRSLSIAILLGAACSLSHAAADAPAAEWKLTVASGPAFPLGRAAARWAQILNDARFGDATVKTYPGATLARRDPLREFLALKDGSADLGVGSALAWSPQVPALAVYALPWSAPTPRALETLAGDPALTAVVAARCEAAGAVLLAVAPLGHEALATTRGPLGAPSDVAALRVRSIALPMVIETVAALGMRPAAMSFADAQAAFTSNSLDGQVGAPAAFAAMRIASFGQKHVLRWGAFADAIVFAVRRPRWDQWNDEQRAAVRSAAQTAAAEAGALLREDDAIAELARTGVTSTRLTSAQRAAFRAVVQPVIERWMSAVGADVVSAAAAALAPLPESER
jgi:TRAP-type C4-dicarboxylate transport system substrate-binding protein